MCIACSPNRPLGLHSSAIGTPKFAGGGEGNRKDLGKGCLVDQASVKTLHRILRDSIKAAKGNFLQVTEQTGQR